MITIFTPTYNRENTLKRLYNSLLSQTITDFEWLIVDDGSIDNTESLIEGFIKEKKLDIIYHKQQNGGKHRAINKGLEYARGEYFFIVDSDDYLLDSSLETINKYYEQIKDDASILGVTGFRGYPDGRVLGGKMFPEQITDSNLIERREKFGVTADMAHVIKTAIFKKFLFPEIHGENFVAESIVWNRMSVHFKMRYFNEIIYICEYLEGGLSYNSIKNRRKNPKYATLLYKELVNNPKTNFSLKIKSLINYWRFALCKTFNVFKLQTEIKNFPISVITMPIGFLFYFKDILKSTIKVNKIK